MNKEDNPFYTLAQHIKPKDAIQQINLGTVISKSPLLVNCNGIQLDKGDLLINKDLLKGFKKMVKINGNKEELENLEGTLDVGSMVVLLTTNNQRFYLICEVI
ncbi:hypothetical protein DP124_12075 [Clostridium tetani]|uniref:DUF2577 family protein n=1 Tax=Clostridium tetani TaxID=1513 RepID=UPI00100AEE4C|nr:DUF2577 family protein [Clostridium tetani]RXI50200.1 hypothetical protein DP124_12075 [Clostridium tetani]